MQAAIRGHLIKHMVISEKDHAYLDLIQILVFI